MTWSKEKSWGNGLNPSFSIDPSMNELGRTDASYQPASDGTETTETIQTPLITPLVLVDNEYVEAPVSGNPRDVFGVEATFDEGGVRVEKTLEAEEQERATRQRYLHQLALKELNIHPPVDWGPERGRISRSDNSVLPDNLTFSA